MGEMLLNGRLYGASGIRELTQSEYDALPASKLTDGILYCIKDTGIVEGEKFAPVIYSLEEREVGVWTDGKPLYVRTWAFINSTSTFNDFVTIPNGTISDCDKVVNLQTVAKRTIDDVVIYLVGGSVISLEKSSISNYRVLARTRNGEVQYYIEQYGTQITDMAITVYYTKTTDTPGSGTWGTDGVPMVHYDGNEKIIGTWFGETLYEKTIDCGAIHTTGSHSTAHGIQNIKRVVRICGNCVSDSNMFFPLPLVQPGDILSYQIRVAANNTNVILSTQSVTDIASTYVTIQYTKTSS